MDRPPTTTAGSAVRTDTHMGRLTILNTPGTGSSRTPHQPLQRPRPYHHPQPRHIHHRHTGLLLPAAPDDGSDHGGTRITTYRSFPSQRHPTPNYSSRQARLNRTSVRTVNGHAPDNAGQAFSTPALKG